MPHHLPSQTTSAAAVQPGPGGAVVLKKCRGWIMPESGAVLCLMGVLRVTSPYLCRQPFCTRGQTRVPPGSPVSSFGEFGVLPVART